MDGVEKATMIVVCAVIALALLLGSLGIFYAHENSKRRARLFNHCLTQYTPGDCARAIFDRSVSR